MSSAQELWLGYGQTGMRATLGIAGRGNKVLLLGSGADQSASLFAFSAKEAGLKPLLLDLDGHLVNTLSGYLDTYDYRSILYDSFRLEPPEAWHAQLVAAAYTTALDLSSEEEAILNSALQQLATQDSIVSPVSLFDVMGKVEGFRGFYVDKLKGRIGSLRLFDAVDDQRFDRLMKGGAIVDFHRAPYPQAAELALALVIAKLLALAHETEAETPPVAVTEAHRLFRATPPPKHSCRLMTQLFDWPGPIFLSSDQPQALSPQVVQACHVRVYCGDAWHARQGKVDHILPGLLMLEDRRSDNRLAFFPRRLAVKTGGYVPSSPVGHTSIALAVSILTEVQRFPLSTRESVVQYFTPEFLPADITAELDSLQARECIVTEPKDTGGGARIFGYTVTEKGLDLLRRSAK